MTTYIRLICGALLVAIVLFGRQASATCGPCVCEGTKGDCEHNRCIKTSLDDGDPVPVVVTVVCWDSNPPVLYYNRAARKQSCFVTTQLCTTNPDGLNVEVTNSCIYAVDWPEGEDCENWNTIYGNRCVMSGCPGG